MPINKYTNSQREGVDNYSGKQNAPASGPSSVLEKDQIVEYAPEQAPKYDWQKGPVRPKISPIESGVRGAIDAGTMNYGDEIYGGIAGAFGKDPEEEAAHQRYMNQEAYGQNPGNYLTGSVAGSMGVAAIPGVGTAVGAGRLMRGGMGALRGAVEGFGSGDDMGSRVSNAITGGTIGGLAGAIGEPIVRGSIEALTPTPTGMFDRARYRAVKSVIGGQAKASRDLIPDYNFHGKQLLEPTEELGGKAVIRFGNNADESQKLAEQARKGVGEKMGAAVSNVDKNASFVSDEAKDSLLKNLKSLPNKLRLPKTTGEAGGNDKAYIDSIYRQIRGPLKAVKDKKTGKVSLELDPSKGSQSVDELTKIRNEIKFIKNAENFELNKTKQEVRNVINDAIKESIEKSKSLYGKGMEVEKQLAEDYPKNTAKYASFAPADEYLQEAAFRNAKNRSIGLTSNIIGSSSISAPGMGMVKGAVLGVINQIGINRGNTALAVSYNNLAKALDVFPEPMKKFYPMLLEASKRGGTSLAVTHAALLNKNPEYKQMIEGGGSQ